MSQLMSNLSKLLSITENTFKTNVVLNGLTGLQIRYRKQIYPRKYREPDFGRKQMLAICEPIYPRDKRQESQRCFNLTQRPKPEPHPFDTLLAQDFKRELSSSPMVCFFHQNVMTKREQKFCANLFQKEDMFLRFYNKDIAELALSGTQWQMALHLCPLHHVVVLFGSKPMVQNVLKVTKKCPQLVLMAAIIDHRFMSVEDIKQYNRLSDLHSLRYQLSSTLSMVNRSIADKTIDPILRLSRSLDSYIRDKSEKS